LDTRTFSPIVGFKPLTQITPFTYRDGATYAYILNKFEQWLKEIGVELETSLNEYLAEIGKIESSWLERFDQFMADVQASLKPLNDESVSELVADTGSKLRIALELMFDEKTAAIAADQEAFKTEIRGELADVNNEIAAQIGTVADKALTYDEVLTAVHLSCWREPGTNNAIFSSHEDSAPTFMVAPFNMRIIGFSIIFDRFSLSQSDVNYLRFRLRSRSKTDADSLKTIVEKRTTTYQGEAIRERIAWNFDAAEWTEANRYVEAGEALTIHWEFFGTAPAIDFPFTLVVRYAPF